MERFNFSFFSITGWGIGLDHHDIEWFALEMNRNHSVIFEMSGKALQIAVKRREVKSKGERERYKHLNAEFQRIARRDKKPFLRDQCKEIKENNRMGKTKDLLTFLQRRHTDG